MDDQRTDRTGGQLEPPRKRRAWWPALGLLIGPPLAILLLLVLPQSVVLGIVAVLFLGALVAMIVIHARLKQLKNENSEKL
jgi:hypothetical protein